MLDTSAIRTTIDRGVLYATLACEPLNLMGPEIVRDLVTIIRFLEATGDEIAVVVFDSGVPGYFSAHVDMAQLPALGTELGRLEQGMSFTGLYHRISELQQVTIASIAGRTGGAGSEFALSCDMRFASRENAVFIQMEAGVGLLPGAGAIQHLPGLMGRARDLEVMLGSMEFSADLAERYGWVNRSMPEVDLMPFVTELAERIASFPRAGVRETKRRVNAVALRSLEEMNEDLRLFRQLGQRPEVQARLGALFASGMQTDGEVERSFGQALSNLSSTVARTDL